MTRAHKLEQTEYTSPHFRVRAQVYQSAGAGRLFTVYHYVSRQGDSQSIGTCNRSFLDRGGQRNSLPVAQRYAADHAQYLLDSYEWALQEHTGEQ